MARKRDWRQTVLAEVQSLPDLSTNRAADASEVATTFLPGAYGAVVEAAKLRRLSLSAYARRSILAMAAHDLDIPLSELLARDSRVTRETGYPIDDPDGTKFGLWEIDHLVGGL